tara:strand:- start:35 stop:499 length:465 start_codon:yes stop_codon:yes gene_type:complete
MSNNKSIKVISTNKKASFLYSLLDKYEAGISLLGSEVKAIRENKVNIKESYIRIKKLELYLIGMHIGEYSHSGYSSHEPLRERKLLLHKREIVKIERSVKESGKTIIPTLLYFKNGKIKLEFSIAKGKKIWDKRSAKKDKDIKRDMDRDIKLKK